MKIAWLSCENLADPGKAMAMVLAQAPDVFISQGDTPYMNGGAAAWGYTTAAAVESTTEAQYLEKFQQFWAKPNAAALLARRASGMLAYYQRDDHELPADNWDHTTTNAGGTHTTQAQVNATWVKATGAYTDFLAASWDNPPPDAAGNTERPAGALQSGQNPPTTAYPILYFYRDFAAGCRSVRIVFLDCMSYRGLRTADGEFLGQQQEAWLQDVLEASATFDWVIVSSTKKCFQSTPPDLDNDDTFGQYPTARNRTLAMIQATGVKVIWISGDRHTPHVMDARVSVGAVADIIDICACPAGVDINGVTGVPYMVWKGWRQCFGLITVRADRLRIELCDAISGSPLWQAEFVPRSNEPIYADAAAAIRLGDGA